MRMTRRESKSRVKEKDANKYIIIISKSIDKLYNVMK